MSKVLLSQKAFHSGEDSIDSQTDSIYRSSNLENQTTLTFKLKAIYKAQNTLPKLIEDDSIPDQKMDDYYVKLNMLLENKSLDAEKQAIELESIFAKAGNQGPVGKILVTGIAGIGKSTLLNYINYQWGQGKLFSDRFDYIFKVKLKNLLDESFCRELNAYRNNQEKLLVLIQRALEEQELEINSEENRVKAYGSISENEIRQIDKSRTLLLLDGYDEIAHLDKIHNDRAKNTVHEIIEAIYGYPNFLMTSRTSIAYTSIQNKFERKIENVGFRSNDINSYVDKYFNAQVKKLLDDIDNFLNKESQNPDNTLKEDLFGYYEENGNNDSSGKKDILTRIEDINEGRDMEESITSFKNHIVGYYGKAKKELLESISHYSFSDLRSLMTTPLNAAMICLVCSDSHMIEQFAGEFNVGSIYKELISWLGKRYISKFGLGDLNYISQHDILASDELKVLKHAAYSKFTANKLVITGSELDTLANDQYHFLNLRTSLNLLQVNKFGLLKPTGSKIGLDLDLKLYGKLDDSKVVDFKMYLYQEDSIQGKQLFYAIKGRNGIERTQLTEDLISSNALNVLKEHFKSKNREIKENEREALSKLIEAKGYFIYKEEKDAEHATKADKEIRELLQKDHTFIHLSFQEYLNALKLKDVLAHETKKEEAAKVIAAHRIEPRYLMTLKFLAGIVSSDTGTQSTTIQLRFWEAVTCNIDGILEFGVDTKVSLFMHLLSQTKVQETAQTEESETEILLQEKISLVKQLIDVEVLKDLSKWSDILIASNYISQNIADVLKNIITSDQDDNTRAISNKAHELLDSGKIDPRLQPDLTKLVTNSDSGPADNRYLREALEITMSQSHKREFRFNEDNEQAKKKEVLYEIILNVLRNQNDWQIQKLCLEQLLQLLDKSTPKELFSKTIGVILNQEKPLIGDKNLKKEVQKLMINILKIDSGREFDVNQNFGDATLIKDSAMFRDLADRKAYFTVASKILEKSAAWQKVLDKIKYLYKHCDSQTKISAMFLVIEAIEFVPESPKESLLYFHSLFDYQDSYVKTVTSGLVNDIVNKLVDHDAYVKQCSIRFFGDTVNKHVDEVPYALKLLEPHFEYYLQSHHNATKRTPQFIHAIIKGNEEIVKNLITPKTINRPDGDLVSPLYYSLGYGRQNINIKIVELLLQNGADTNQRAFDGDTPMHMNYKGNKEAVELLLRYGGDINAQNHEGKTPLHSILSMQNLAVGAKLEVIKEFLTKYDILLLDKEGRSVVDYAKVHCPDALTLLLSPEAGSEVQKNTVDDSEFVMVSKDEDSQSQTLGVNLDNSHEIVFESSLQIETKSLETPNTAITKESKSSKYNRYDILLQYAKLVRYDSNPLSKLEKLLDHPFDHGLGLESIVAVAKSQTNNAMDAIKIITDYLFKEMENPISDGPIAHLNLVCGIANKLVEIVESNPKTSGEVIDIMLSLYNYKTFYVSVKSAATVAIAKIAKIDPSKVDTAFEIISQQLDDGDWNVRVAAIKSIAEFVKISPKKADEAFGLISRKFHDSNNMVTQVMPVALRTILEVKPELGELAFNFLRPFFNSNNWSEKRDAIESISAVLKAYQASALEVLTILSNMFGDDNLEVSRNLIREFTKIVTDIPETKNMAFEIIRNTLTNENNAWYLRYTATQLIGPVVADSPELALEAFPLLCSIFQDINMIFGSFENRLSYSIKTVQQYVDSNDHPVTYGWDGVRHNEDHSNNHTDAANSTLRTLVDADMNDIPELKSAIVKRYSNLGSEVDILEVFLTEFVRILKTQMGLKRDPQVILEIYHGRSGFTAGAAVEAIGKAVNTLPELAKSAFNILLPVLQFKDITSSQPTGLAHSLANVMGEIVKVAPSCANEALQILNFLMDHRKPHKKYDIFFMRQSAAMSIIEIVKANPALDEGFCLLQEIFSSRSELKKEFITKLPEIVGNAPNRVLDVMNILLLPINFLWNEFTSEAKNSISQIIGMIDITNLTQLNLLNHKDLTIRNAAINSIPSKLASLFNDSIGGSVEEKLSSEPSFIGTLLSIIGHESKISEENVKSASIAAKNTLDNIIGNITHDTLEVVVKWINGDETSPAHEGKESVITLRDYEYDKSRHFKEFLSISNYTTIFFKKIFHKVLGSPAISANDKEFILNCIKTGFTATFTDKGEIVFEGFTYQLMAIQDVFSELLQSALLQENILSKHYIKHNPLFDNTGSAIPKAAVDIANTYGITQELLSSKVWSASVMHLSNQQNELKDIFVLLETRDYFGNIIIHKIDKSGNCSDYRLHPHALDTNIRREICGNMEYDREGHVIKKPIYVVSSLDCEISLGKIVKFLSEIKSFTGNIKDISQVIDIFNKTTEAFDKKYLEILGLQFPWSEYRLLEHPSKREFNKKDILNLHAQEVDRFELDERDCELSGRIESHSTEVNKRLNNHEEDIGLSLAVTGDIREELNIVTSIVGAIHHPHDNLE